MSWLTSTCPSQSGPAPMPMVGTDSAAVTCRAASAPNGLDDHRKDAGPFERVRFLDQGFDVFALHGLPPIAAHLVQRLGLEPEVAHYRDAHLHHATDGADDRQAALHLHRGGAGLQQASSVADRLLDAHLIGHEGHVGHHERALSAAGHGARVVQHVVERHRQRVLVAEHHHAHRVAHEQHVDAGAVEKPRHRRVVGGEHGNLLAAAFPLAQVGHAYFGVAHGSRDAAALSGWPRTSWPARCSRRPSRPC